MLSAHGVANRNCGRTGSLYSDCAVAACSVASLTIPARIAPLRSASLPRAAALLGGPGLAEGLRDGARRRLLLMSAGWLPGLFCHARSLSFGLGSRGRFGRSTEADMATGHMERQGGGPSNCGR